MVPATGWYEWQTLPGKRKQPWRMHMRGGQPLAFAGLWERWKGEDEVIESNTIIVVRHAETVVARLEGRAAELVAAGESPDLTDGPTVRGIGDALADARTKLEAASAAAKVVDGDLQSAQAKARNAEAAVRAGSIAVMAAEATVLAVELEVAREVVSDRQESLPTWYESERGLVFPTRFESEA